LLPSNDRFSVVCRFFLPHFPRLRVEYRLPVWLTNLPLPPITRSMAADDLIHLELMLNRFRRLLGEPIRGTLARNHFPRWEVEILPDLESCWLDPPSGASRLYPTMRKPSSGRWKPPMKLSAYLETRARRREEAFTAEQRGGPRSCICRPTRGGSPRSRFGAPPAGCGQRAPRRNRCPARGRQLAK